MNIILQFLQNGALGHFSLGNMLMLVVGCIFLYLAITKDYEPLLLVPIGFGILVGNIPYGET